MINSVGYVDYFNAPNNAGVRQVTQEQEAALQNSVFGCSYPYPKNPGLIPPKKDNKAAKTAAGVIGTLGALALAVMFRGKIKGGVVTLINKVKPYVPKSIKTLVKKGLKFAKPVTDFVIKYTRKGIKIVDPILNPVKKFIVKVAKPVINLFRKAPAAAKP